MWRAFRISGPLTSKLDVLLQRGFSSGRVRDFPMESQIEDLQSINQKEKSDDTNENLILINKLQVKECGVKLKLKNKARRHPTWTFFSSVASPQEGCMCSSLLLPSAIFSHDSFTQAPFFADLVDQKEKSNDINISQTTNHQSSVLQNQLNFEYSGQPDSSWNMMSFHIRCGELSVFQACIHSRCTFSSCVASPQEGCRWSSLLSLSATLLPHPISSIPKTLTQSPSDAPCSHPHPQLRLQLLSSALATCTEVTGVSVIPFDPTMRALCYSSRLSLLPNVPLSLCLYYTSFSISISPFCIAHVATAVQEKLYVKVVKLWYHKIPTLDHSQNLLHMVLMDENLISNFVVSLNEGDVYLISHFTVVPNTGLNRVTKHRFRLLFQYKTSVVCVVSLRIPHSGLCFTSIDEIDQMTKDHNFLIDFIGIITRVRKERDVASYGKMIKVVVLKVFTHGKRVQCNMFGNACHLLEYDNLKKYPRSPLIVLESFKIKAIEEISNIQDLHADNGDSHYFVFGTIKEVMDKPDWWYYSCVCGHVVVEHEDLYLCDACGSCVEHVMVKYEIRLKIHHGGCAVLFVLLDNAVTKLFGKICSEAFLRIEEEFPVDPNVLAACRSYSPQMFDDVVGEEKVFKYATGEDYKTQVVCENYIQLETIEDIISDLISPNRYYSDAENGGFVFILGTISSVLKNHKWWFSTCLCGSLVSTNKNIVSCDLCQLECIDAIPRFCLKVVVSHANRNNIFVLKDHEVGSYCKVVPLKLISSLLHKKVVFMVDARPMGYEMNRSVYIVQQIWDDASVINIFEAATEMNEHKFSLILCLKLKMFSANVEAIMRLWRICMLFILVYFGFITLFGAQRVGTSEVIFLITFSFFIETLTLPFSFLLLLPVATLVYGIVTHYFSRLCSNEVGDLVCVIDDESFDWKLIRTIDNLKGNNEDGQFFVVGKIKEIVEDPEWWIFSCVCGHPIVGDDNMFHCQLCSRDVQHFMIRIKILVEDGTSCGMFVLLDSAATKLLGRTCSDVFLLLEDEMDVWFIHLDFIIVYSMNNYFLYFNFRIEHRYCPQFFHKLLGKEIVFKVQAKRISTQGYYSTFKVINIVSSDSAFSPIFEDFSQYGQLKSYDTQVISGVPIQLHNIKEMLTDILCAKIYSSASKNISIYVCVFNHLNCVSTCVV
ncbi:hypothetical protein Ahy_A04g019594 isoform A [Arachis hypogaea]|uniref:Replication protein A 70 kDa DNA-binding subunit B/D first OB fold domain-containing protein n=1 Tax=Arachis hypogaea TaxID=3818 RepID=A0A445DGE5_ARAHY|nr:hypothetical protein Ahy_A04g019594 isoform A [Arachis hypogaea]